MKAAVAIGGASALSACLDRSDVDVPRGPQDLSTLPDRQHAWNAALDEDDAGNPRQPRHRLLLALDYGDGVPTDADRETVENALRGLERAYERSNRGLFVTVSYSPYYFERFDAPLPESVDLPKPTALASFEDPAPDDVDAVVHLASDNAPVLLGAEEALKGEQATLNGVDQPETPLTDAFTIRDRRTGFVGEGLPAEHTDVEGVPEGDDHVPEEAPLYMGFKSGFKGNQATEERVTIQDGPFAGGTTQHVSKLSLDLKQWYTQDSRDQRVSKMFCPLHASNDEVEGTGENLGTQTNSDLYGEPVGTARRLGVVGHSQKMVPLREDDRPIILRRDFDSTDGGRAGVHFLALQRGIGEFVKTREAMNGAEVTERSAVGQRTNNGILQYMDVARRGNFLLPPRSLRALPPANPEAAEVDRAA